MLVVPGRGAGNDRRRTSRAYRPTAAGAYRFSAGEAVVNALAHRDLSPQSRGTAVQAQLFVDRLVITNPGGLFGPVSVDTLGSAGVTSARNATLMQLLEDAVRPQTGEAIVEHRGTGIPVMIQALRSADMSPPRFEDGVSTFCVTFPRHSLVDPQTLSWLAGLGDAAQGLSRDQRNALVLMKAGEVMSNARYRQISDTDSRVATRELADLVSRKLAEVVGGGGYTCEARRPHAESIRSPCGAASTAGTRTGSFGVTVNGCNLTSSTESSRLPASVRRIYGR